ncbi:sulfotransferase [Xinfangfangia pollutisoli]|uniref:sulfotransferase n=1 Tax=Xinfangfangia pollutisoli TaxID=2865960 RepID=UPI001CD1EA24|nr:sulfotransferase [Xinfangfangia pollutisoli]
MTPNLFLLGAGKSGTTSVWSMLADHPDVHMSRPKEPSFFCSHFQVVKNPVTYFGLFDSPRRWRGDASHVYMTNPETAPILRDLFPEARFVLTLRAPKARAHALYRHMRRFTSGKGTPHEPHERFAAALAAEEARFADPEFPARCGQYAWNFFYCRSCFYDEQLARYLALFPRDRFHVQTLADLSHRPAETATALADFLQIDPGPLIAAATQVRNADPNPYGWTAEEDAWMEARFAGLTARTEALVGRALDWSL